MITVQNKPNVSLCRIQKREFVPQKTMQVPTFRGGITLHETLSQDIWQGQTLKPEVEKSLEAIAEGFERTLVLPFQKKDLVIVGSMAGHNYGKSSDIDLHLVTDFKSYGAEQTLLTDYFKSKRDMFNYTNSFMVYGHPVEVNVENAEAALHSSGRYSIMSKQWLKKPFYDANLILPEVENLEKYKQLKQSLDECLAKKDWARIEPLFKELYALRQNGLAQGGELSSGNRIFKELRNQGYVKRLIDLSYAFLNNLVSLK